VSATAGDAPWIASKIAAAGCSGLRWCDFVCVSTRDILSTANDESINAADHARAVLKLRCAS